MKPLAALAILLAGGVALFLFLESPGAGRGERGGIESPILPNRPDPSSALAEREASGPETRLASTERQREVATVAQAPSEETHRFFGTVLGENLPLAGALLRLVSDGDELSSVHADERGVFELTCTVPRQDLQLEVLGRGYVPLSRQLGPIERGGTKMVGNVRMMPGILLRGSVVNEEGQPIAGAKVQASPSQRGMYVLKIEGQADENGEFELRDAPRGRIALTASAAGYGEQTSERVHIDASPIQIKLARGRTLIVRVHDGRGSPVGDVLVELSSNHPNAPRRQGMTDAEGRCRFEGLGSELWTVRATKEHYRPGIGGQLLANGVENAIELPPWAAIEGKVLGSDGSPAPPGTEVRALPQGAPGDLTGRQAPGIAVEADGRFRIPGLQPGRWVVHVQAPGHSPYATQPINMGLENDEYVGNLRLLPSARIAFQFLSEAGPLSRAQVEIATQAPRPARLFAPLPGAARPALHPARNDGTLTLENVAAGDFWVVVRAEGYTPLAKGPFRLVPGKTLGPERIQLEPASKLTGSLMIDGQAVAGTRVRVVERAVGIGFPLTLSADKDGRFESQWIPAGTYDLEVLVPGKDARTFPSTAVTLKPGETGFVELGS